MRTRGAIEREQPGPGQESVWDYPRPPALVPSTKHLELSLDGHVVARTDRALRILETSHPPTWYLPLQDVDESYLRLSSAPSTTCEYKGAATYWDVVVPGRAPLEAAAWGYEHPRSPYADLTDHLAFRADVLVATVDGERVRPQEGGFYAGWITDDVVGPFKGSPGSWGW